jgi:hypothetical protein
MHRVLNAVKNSIKVAQSLQLQYVTELTGGLISTKKLQLMHKKTCPADPWILGFRACLNAFKCVNCFCERYGCLSC